MVRAVRGIVPNLWRGHCSCSQRYQQRSSKSKCWPWNPGVQGATGRWEGRDRMSCISVNCTDTGGVKAEVFVLSKWNYWLGLAESQPLTLRIKGSLQTNWDTARAMGLSQLGEHNHTPDPGIALELLVFFMLGWNIQYKGCLGFYTAAQLQRILPWWISFQWLYSCL